jgi:hypothetical protein
MAGQTIKIRSRSGGAVTQPVYIIWGDQDHAASPVVSEVYRVVSHG